MKPKFILVMGVSGSGKTTVGDTLATRLGWNFFDGDDFHTPENIAKMKAGIPLDDKDRFPWLGKLNRLIFTCIKENAPGILACSALKEQYRQILLRDYQNVLVVYLKGSYELIWSRMSGRSDHYMKPEMLKSQFEALEEPNCGLIIDIALPVEVIVEMILNEISVD
jgi:gluconokinase